MNFLYPRNNFINLAIPKGPAPTKYNKIYFEKKGSDNLSCDILKQAQMPCNTKCTPNFTVHPTSTLSDSEIAVLYKYAYETSGLEIMNRLLNENENEN